MSEPKWPQGPWKIEGAGGRDVGVYAPGHGFVGISHLGGPNPDWDERTRAAMVLQSAAPELYAALEGLIDRVGAPAHDPAFAILAKARGEAST